MKRTQKRREPARCDQSNSKTCSEPVQARLPVPFSALHSGSTTDAGSRRLPANSARHKISCSTAKTPAYVLFLAYSISVQKHQVQNSVETKYFSTPLCPRCFRVESPPALQVGEWIAVGNFPTGDAGANTGLSTPKGGWNRNSRRPLVLISSHDPLSIPPRVC